MGSALDEQDGTPNLESPGTSPSGVSGLRRRAEEPLDFDALEADLNRQLSDLPKLFTERPTKPAPPMTAAMRVGPPDVDRDEATPVRPFPGILPPPPRAPRPESFAPAAAPAPPRPHGDDILLAALVETHALKSGLGAMLRGATVFATIIVVLLCVLVLQTGTSSAGPTPVAKAVTAAPAPAPVKRDMVEIGLITSPRSAMFRIDHGPWLTGPYEVKIPRDDRDHEVYVAAEGYFPRAVKIRFTKDTLFDIVLSKDTAPSKDSASSARRVSGRGL